MEPIEGCYAHIQCIESGCVYTCGCVSVSVGVSVCVHVCVCRLWVRLRGQRGRKKNTAVHKQRGKDLTRDPLIALGNVVTSDDSKCPGICVLVCMCTSVCVYSVIVCVNVP